MEFNEPWCDTCSKVGWAARVGNVEYLCRFLSEKNPVDVGDNRGWRPVHEAAAVPPSPDCLQELLKHEGTNINWLTHENETALLLACKRRQGSAANDFVKILLQNGADPNIPDNEADTPLLEALRNQNKYVVEKLIAAGANVNAADCSGWSPLHEAASKKNSVFVHLLLKNGALIDVRDECGMTPIFSAAQHGCVESLEAILLASKMKGVVNMGAEDWATPLMIAAQQGFVNCVTVLLKHGADPNLKTSDNATALHMAVQANSTLCLELLVQKMCLEPLIAAFHPTTYQYSGMICPLHLAVEWKNHASLKILLEAGFSPDSLYNCSYVAPIGYVPFLPDCETALSYAVFKRDKVSISILLAAGANPSPPVQIASHPILRAMGAQGNMEEFQTLLKSGTDINFQRETSPSNEVLLFSLLVNAAYLRPLLYHGCDPNLCFQPGNDIFQRTATRFIRKENMSLRSFLKLLMRFLIISKPVQNTFLALSRRFTEDISDILREIDQPSPLQHICTIKIRQHLYSIHGVKLPHVIQKLQLPPVLIEQVSCTELNNS